MQKTGAAAVANSSDSSALFRSKAETLEALSGRVKSARILPQCSFSVAQWQESPADILKQVEQMLGARNLAVRSSAQCEDQMGSSMAGAFTSRLNVAPADLSDAIRDVIQSYGEAAAEDRVLIQPMVERVSLTAVAFTADPATGAPYYLINYDDCSGDTTSVTGGRHDQLKTWIGWKLAKPPAGALGKICALLAELETLCGHAKLDVECAVDDQGEPVLLQVRPLHCAEGEQPPTKTVEHALEQIEQKIELGMRRHPFLHGDSTVYGVMPDWNPAEIIGIRPKPLALSLYRELVTDSTWAYQRDNYGYKNLRSFPLMLHFFGLPYIDVRVSFNSFIPRDIEGSLADRLVNYYMQRLLDAPALHDKVEFEIVFSCYTLDIKERAQQLKAHGFTDREIDTLTNSLRKLTNRIVHRETGLWVTDSEKLRKLEKRREQILSADMDKVSRIYWLLEDCKRYGTLPFAGLARAGFIAVQMLRSLVNTGVLSGDDYHRFMNSLNAVSSQMTRDFQQMDRTNFLSKYGHLRPGTYDILSPRYDETPDGYFDWSAHGKDQKTEHRERFALSLEQMRCIGKLLTDHGLEHDVVGLFDFLQAGIELREYSKFIFTRNLSDAIALFGELGKELGFNEEELAYADIRCVYEMYAGGLDPKALLRDAIARGRERFALTSHLLLPPLITSPADVRAFHMPPSEPNFITHKRITAPVCAQPKEQDLEGTIVFIPSADPGYDWLFSHPIAGFVTAYGGANSHMAIRAGELGLPAIIGAGQTLFDRWSQAELLHLDCAGRRVEIIR